MYGRFPTLDIAIKRDTQRWRELLHASLWHRLQEFLCRLSAYRLDAFRRYLRQWNQHKRAFRHAWMRYRQVILLYMQVIIQKNIDIDGSRPITKRGLSAQFRLNLFHIIQQRFRIERSLTLQHNIQKARLVGKPHRLRIIDRRDAGNLEHLAQALQSGSQVPAPIP